MGLKMLACAVSAAIAAMTAAPAVANEETNLVLIGVSVLESSGYVNTAPRYVKAVATNVDNGREYPLSDGGTYGTAGAAVPDGRYRLSVYNDVGAHSLVRTATSWWPGVFSQASSGVFTLRHDATTCDPYTENAGGCHSLIWTVQLQQNRTLTGFVRNRHEAGQPGRVVSAVRQDEPSAQYSATTDSVGRYVLSIPPGRYDLSTPNGNTIAKVEDLSIQQPSQVADLRLADVPSPPREVVAAAGSRRLSVAWTAPADDGGAGRIAGYRATATPGGQSCTTDDTNLGCVIDGLANNRAYTVTVTARTAVGTSLPSPASNEVIPLDPAPAAPQGLRATAGDQSVTLFWTPPRAGADTVTGYRVTSTPRGFTCTTTDLTCTVSGLANGTAYIFWVTARSTGGESGVSEPSSPVTPAGVPSPPRSVKATPGNKSLRVSWNAPVDNGGAHISEYVATAWPGGRVCTTSERSCAIGGLTNGQAYSVTVTATNRVGTSERSPGSIPVTPKASLPTKKVNVARVQLMRGAGSTVRWSVAGASQVRVSWQRVGGGTRHIKKADGRGRIVLKGAAGSRHRVTVAGVTKTGQKVSKTRVFTIGG